MPGSPASSSPRRCTWRPLHRQRVTAAARIGQSRCNAPERHRHHPASPRAGRRVERGDRRTLPDGSVGCMKITNLKNWIVEGDAWNWTCLKLYTDEGLTGIGEATLEYSARTGAGSLEEAREFIVGRNPFHVESFLQDIQYRTFWQGPALYAIMAGVEMAMWDIVGKALNQPVYNLLGGPCHQTLRAY